MCLQIDQKVYKSHLYKSIFIKNKKIYIIRALAAERLDTMKLGSQQIVKIESHYRQTYAVIILSIVTNYIINYIIMAWTRR